MELPKDISEALKPAFAEADEFEARVVGAGSVYEPAEVAAYVKLQVSKRNPSSRFVYGRRAPRA